MPAPAKEPPSSISGLGVAEGPKTSRNLAIVHGRCNWEKGVRWDPKKRRGQDEYEAFIAGLLERRRSRWHAEEHPAGRGPDPM